MIVTSLLIPEFGPSESKVLIETLGSLQAELKSVSPPGYVQTLLLRENAGQAVLLTFWDSQQDLSAFLSTELGQRLSKSMGGFRPGKSLEYRNYFVTWQSDSPVYEPRRKKNCGC
jgi:heme-degrading monooxygenase HmoA